MSHSINKVASVKRVIDVTVFSILATLSPVHDVARLCADSATSKRSSSDLSKTKNNQFNFPSSETISPRLQKAFVFEGALFSAVKQNIHFCLIPSSEFLPATSQFPVREISGSFLETLCEVLGMFDLRLCVSLHLNKTTNQSNIVFFHWAPL